VPLALVVARTASGKQLHMTQEFIPNMLGVRRDGVSTAAGKLHKLDVIR
jgi:CRP-like cAMP-binding protein